MPAGEKLHKTTTKTGMDFAIPACAQAMKEKTTDAAKPAHRSLIERASNLNEKGARYFLGWLVSAGMEKPELMNELERALHRFESEPSSEHHFAPRVEAGEMTKDGSPPVLRRQQPASPPENPPENAGEVSIAEDLIGANEEIAAKSALSSLFPPNLLKTLFGKSRIARIS